MADYTAIFEAGSALVELLRDRLTPDPISKPEMISLCSPHESENNMLTVWMYHMEEESRSGSMAFMSAGPGREQMAAADISAYYLLTAHSKAPQQVRQADQYRILGAAFQAVRDEPVIEAAYLSGSLARTQAELHVSVERPGFDQMIKIWNNTSSAFKPSIAVKITGISIDSARSRTVSRVTDIRMDVEQKEIAAKGGRK